MIKLCVRGHHAKIKKQVRRRKKQQRSFRFLQSALTARAFVNIEGMQADLPYAFKEEPTSAGEMKWSYADMQIARDSIFKAEYRYL